MEIPATQWSSAAFNTVVSSRVLLQTATGGEKHPTLGQEAEVLNTKNIFDLLKEEGTGMELATDASSSAGEISQEAYSVPANLSTTRNEQVDKAFTSSIMPDIGMQNSPTTHFSDIQEQENLPLDIQEKENQRVNVPAQVLAEESSEQSQNKLEHRQTSLSLNEVKDLFIPPNYSNQKGGANNQRFALLNHIQQGINTAETELIKELKTHPNMPDTNPSAQRTPPVHLEYGNMSALSTPETMAEEITYQSATTGKNNPTPQATVSLLGKPVEHQNISYTNHLSVPDESHTPTEPDTISLTKQANKNIANETNSKPSLLNHIQQEMHTPTESKITVKGVTNQYVIASNNTVEVTNVITNEAKDETKSPQTTIPPINVNNIKPQNIPPQIVNEQAEVSLVEGEKKDSPRDLLFEKTVKSTPPERDFKPQNMPPQIVDEQAEVSLVEKGRKDSPQGLLFEKIAKNTSPERDLKSQNIPSQIVDEQTEVSLVEEEKKDSPRGLLFEKTVKSTFPERDFKPLKNKIADLSLLKAEFIPDNHSNKLPTNPITNEQNTSFNTSSFEGFDRQSVKDVPKMNNPNQLPEPHYNNVLDQIAQKIRVHLREGKWDLNLKLEPPELGLIKLKFSVKGNRLEANIKVENLNVLHAIERDIPRLKDSISSAGIDVGRLDVLYDEGNDARHSQYSAQHTNHETQRPTKEDTDIETIEKTDKESAITGINNALEIGRIDYIA
ncbi:MAG: flagellar hook-length control protein FliK [Candidatus Brocadiales bacterium]